MQAAFYATPIIYPLALVIEKSELAAKIIMMNPIAQAIQGARYVLVTTESVTVASLFGNGWYVLVPLVIVVFTFIGGTLYFRKHSKYFAENI
jgi:ABC-2 type transport system permease protein